MTGDNKLVTRTWLNWFNFLGQAFGFNQSIQVNGKPFPGESAINFLSPFTATDNRVNGSTDIGITIAVPVANSDGVSLDLGGGYKSMWGQSLPSATGVATSQVGVSFPVPFVNVPVVTCSPDNQPNPPNNDPFVCYPSSITETGFIANFSCPVLIGGSGAPGIESVVHCNWTAYGV